MNRKYVATLALMAVMILVLGLLIRPKEADHDALPATDGTTLQQLSRERELRDQASYFAERVEAVAPQLVYLPDAGASGVRWDSTSLVATTRPAATISLVRLAQPDDTVDPAPAVEPGPRTRWVLAVARRADGSTVSAAGLNGGTATVQCNDASYREIVLDVALHPALAGGGLFDLSGRRLGLIVFCGNRLAALPVAEVERALRELESVPALLKRNVGLSVTRLDPRTGAYFQRDKGALVVEVEGGGAAAAWGLRAGDIIDSIDDQPVDSANDLRALLADSSAQHALAVTRAGAPVNLRTSGIAPGARAGREEIGLATSAGWTIVTSVPPGTSAYQAGLRPDDRIVQVDRVARPNPTVVQRALARADTTPVFIVLQRGAVQRGVLIPPR